MSLYSGSGAYYAAGRMPYPPAIATALLPLDGSGIGGGPGRSDDLARWRLGARVRHHPPWRAGDDPLPHPRPPWDEAEELVVRHLGTVQKLNTRSGQEDVMRAAGFLGPVRIEVPRGEIVERSADEVVSSMFSLSWSAPHFFGERVGAFEADLRDLLRTVSPNGLFSERVREIELVIWRPRS